MSGRGLRQAVKALALFAEFWDAPSLSSVWAFQVGNICTFGHRILICLRTPHCQKHNIRTRTPEMYNPDYSQPAGHPSQQMGYPGTAYSQPMGSQLVYPPPYYIQHALPDLSNIVNHPWIRLLDSDLFQFLSFNVPVNTTPCISTWKPISHYVSNKSNTWKTGGYTSPLSTSNMDSYRSWYTCCAIHRRDLEARTAEETGSQEVKQLLPTPGHAIITITRRRTCWVD